jgi:hypothetical protein
MPSAYPPRLKSGYESVLERYGPPIIPSNFPQHENFESCCDRWELSLFLPIVETWATTKQEAPRHWPVLAFAVDQYVFLSDHFSKGGMISVADAADALTLVNDGASKLARGITRLYKMSTALPSKSFERNAQIEKLFERIIAMAFGGASTDLDNPLALLGADALIRSFLVTVEQIGRVARDEAKNLNRDALKGKREGQDRALPRLVSIGGADLDEPHHSGSERGEGCHWHSGLCSFCAATRQNRWKEKAE